MFDGFSRKNMAADIYGVEDHKEDAHYQNRFEEGKEDPEDPVEETQGGGIDNFRNDESYKVNDYHNDAEGDKESNHANIFTGKVEVVIEFSGGKG